MSETEKAIFHRSALLLGPDVMEAVGEKKVILFGVGGVGSWCAEGLVRSGIRHLTIVDSDRVSITNVNRQLPATVRTVGQVKVDVLRDRLLEINPEAEITALQKIYSEETHEEFQLSSYDYIIDAVDSLKDKISLILRATETPAVFFSSMGAALKLDPAKVRVSEFWDVRGCPLGAILRKRMRRAGTFPSKKFLCVYDEEVLPNRGEGMPGMYEPGPQMAVEDGPGDRELLNHDWSDSKAQINGTCAHVTAIFGMTLSGLVIQDIYKKALSAAE